MKRLALALGTLLAYSGTLPAENWPEWRGPAHDGESKETGLPAAWGPTKNLVWKLPMPGPGSSTPAVWGDRIFVTSTQGDRDVLLLCVGTDGKERWQRKLGTLAQKVRTPGGEGNGASPSPTTDGKHVFALAGSGDLACFEFDGTEVWRVNTRERYGPFRMSFGFHSTPVLYGDRIYLAFLYTGGQWVVALDARNGAEVWKLNRESDGRAECEHSYASPMLWQSGSAAYLLVHGNDYTTAHRLNDGKEIWRLGDLNPKSHYNATLRFVASPASSPDFIVVPSAKNGPVVGVRPDASGKIDAGGDGEVWRRPHGTPDVPSPLVHDGLVYLCRENGLLICMEAKSGKELYSQRLHEGRYRASPVYADGKVYLAARDGTVTVVKAGPRFEKLAENKMHDELAASPAVSGGRIYLRGFDALYALGER